MTNSLVPFCLLPALLLGNALTPAFAADWAVADVTPVLQTKALTEADMDADADDPAIYLGADVEKSFVVTAVKNAGIRVYSLKGEVMQVVEPHPDGGRINNVDLVYGFKLGDGSTADIVVGSDRGLDIIRVWKIDPSAAEPLTEITAADAPRAFPKRPDHSTGVDADNPVDDQATVYGLAAYKDEAGMVWIVGTQRQEPVVGVYTLEAHADGTVAAKFDHDFRVPAEHKGQNLYEENDDPLKDWSPQFEGSVIDCTNGTVYAGEEDVGIWAVPVTGGEPKLVYETRGSSASSFNNPESVVSRDLEGLTIYYGAEGTKYLLVSSQGGAHGDAPAVDAPYDDSFATFDITGDTPKLLGSFRVSAAGDMDAVQESDGADVLSTALPGYPNGLFVTQDGYAGDLNNLDGETASTNFKFVDWGKIAASFDPPLAVVPDAYDPRK